MDWREILETSFLVAFWAGFAFTIGSALLSGAFHQEFGAGSAFEGGHATELGGADIEAGSHDAGHAHVGWTDSNFPGASPLSPTVLAAAVTGFGAVGYLALHHWEFGNLGSVSLGLLGSLILGGATFLVMHLMFTRLQSTSHVTSFNLIGSKVLVSTVIEPGQAGAIAIEAQGSRMPVPARADDPSRIPVGAEVEIVRVDGGVYVVKETRESWLARSKSQSSNEQWR